MIRRTGVAFVAVSIALVSFALIGATSGVAVAKEKELHVGCIMPFSGPAAPWGEAIRPHMEIFADLVNEDGGLKIGEDTYKVKMFFGDGQYAPGPGATAARNLIFRNNVSVILGYYGNGMGAISPITNKEKVILISKSGSAIEDFDPKKDRYVVFGTPAQELFVYQIVSLMKGNPQAKKLGWIGPDFTKAMFDEKNLVNVNKWLQDQGKDPVRMYYFPENTQNFTPYVSKMAEEGVDIVDCAGNVLEVALFAKQRWEAGHKWPVMEMGTLINPEIFIQIAGFDACQGIVSDRPAPWELKDVKVPGKYLAMTQRLRDRFQEKFNKPLVYVGSFGYGLNHMALYFEAVQQAGTVDPDAVVKTIRGGSFDTFLGTYKTSGIKKWGANISIGYPMALGVIKGKQEEYLSENPLWDVDKWLEP